MPVLYRMVSLLKLAVFCFLYRIILFANRAVKFYVGEFHIPFDGNICNFEVIVFCRWGIAMNNLGYFLAEQFITATRTKMLFEIHEKRILTPEAISFYSHSGAPIIRISDFSPI